MKKTFDEICNDILKEETTNPTSVYNKGTGMDAQPLNKPTVTTSPSAPTPTPTPAPTTPTKLDPQHIIDALTQAQKDPNLHKAFQGIMDAMSKNKELKAASTEDQETNASQA